MSGLNSDCRPSSFFPGNYCKTSSLILGHGVLSDSAIMKVKLSHYRPLGLGKVEASRISRQSVSEGGKVVVLTRRLPGTNFC